MLRVHGYPGVTKIISENENPPIGLSLSSRQISPRRCDITLYFNNPTTKLGILAQRTYTQILYSWPDKGGQFYGRKYSRNGAK